MTAAGGGRSACGGYGAVPAVVLGVEQEVGADDGDADGHHRQDHQHQQHEAVHVVDLVGPERCEDEVPGRREAVRRPPGASASAS